MNDIPVFKFAIRAELEDSSFSFLPQKAEPLATGWDCRACQYDRKDLIVRPGQHIMLPLGFRAFPPEGWWFQLHPRSSSFAKKHMHCLVGNIDESYPKEVLLAFQYLPDINSMGRDLVIKFGDPIAQLVPFRRIEMEVELVSNEKYDEMCASRVSYRTGGFGSTDKKREKERNDQ
jgi:dUTPase